MSKVVSDILEELVDVREIDCFLFLLKVLAIIRSVWKVGMKILFAF